MLIKDYYSVENTSTQDNITTFCVRLNPSCNVYQGHFPEKAVSPGVCNIQMIKECAEQVAGCSLLLTNLQLCRLTTLITPDEHPELDIHIDLTTKEDGYLLKANIGKENNTYLELKAELIKDLI